MRELIQLLWHVPTVMAVLLAAGLIMGQRQVGELSVFDLLTGIAIGAVAGAGNADPDLPHLPILAVVMGLAILHYGVTWAKMRWLPVGRAFTFEPTVVVKHGKPLRANMQQVRMTLSDLLPLLREKDIFDLREVEYGVLEPDGKVTVIKAQGAPKPTGLPRAVVLDGVVETQLLAEVGWDEMRLRQALQQQGMPHPQHIFLATLDEAGSLYAVPRTDTEEQPKILH